MILNESINGPLAAPVPTLVSEEEQQMIDAALRYHIEVMLTTVWPNAPKHRDDWRDVRAITHGLVCTLSALSWELHDDMLLLNAIAWCHYLNWENLDA